MNCSEMAVSMLSTGQVPPSLPPGSPAMSRADCVSLCFISAYCTTMFYNKDTKSCNLMEGFNQTQLVVTSEPVEHLVLGKAACPIKSGYLYNRRLKMCYKKHIDPKVWSDAKTSCSAVGSYLVIINSAERNQFMYDIAADIGQFWTSGHLLGSSWTWGDNSSIAEPTFWSPGEPEENRPTSRCLTFYDLNLSNSWHCGNAVTHGICL
ncbi:C-type lectin domain family 4 member E-like [Haliotis rubra]|uniref:C-type lectin domain family 4 member E-like n=1 Tax=Haliotis rubra TaxID=36100 RepID=UPI001EE509FF|nr:C-type lectin domain family 4 member E-like [Haliotis rubra]